MTTKYKIILGLVCMMVIMTVISVLGYLNMDEALTRIDEYRRLARISVQLNAGLADFDAAVAYANRFLVSRDEKFMRDALDAMDSLDKNLEASIKDIKIQKNLDIVTEIRKSGRAYKENLEKVTAEIKHMQEEFRTTVFSSRTVMEEMMNLMTETAHRVNNTTMLWLLQQMEREYANMRSTMENFILTRSDEHGKAALASGEALISMVKRSKSVITVQQIHEVRDKMEVAGKIWLGTVKAMVDTAKGVNAAIAKNRTIRAYMNKALPELREDLEILRGLYGAATSENVTFGQNIKLIGSAAETQPVAFIAVGYDH